MTVTTNFVHFNWFLCFSQHIILEEESYEMELIMY